MRAPSRDDEVRAGRWCAAPQRVAPSIVGQHALQAVLVAHGVAGQVLVQETGDQRLEEAVHVEQEAGHGGSLFLSAQRGTLPGQQQLDDRQSRAVGRSQPVALTLDLTQQVSIERHGGDAVNQQRGQAAQAAAQEQIVWSAASPRRRPARIARLWRVSSWRG